MTNIRKIGIEAHYQKHRLAHPDAIEWSRVTHYALNGDEFGTPLKMWQWSRLLKAAPNTVLKWLPLIMDYVTNTTILNEHAADVIIQATIKKQKGHS